MKNWILGLLLLTPSIALAGLPPVSLAPVGLSPNAAAGSCIGNRCTLQPADATHPGLVPALPLSVVNGGFGLSGAQTDISTAGDIPALVPATTVLNFTSNTQAINLRGIVPNGTAQRLIIKSSSIQPLILRNQDPGASLANRFDLVGGADLILTQGYEVEIIRNTTTSRWNLASPRVPAIVHSADSISLSNGDPNILGVLLKVGINNLAPNYVLDVAGGDINVNGHYRINGQISTPWLLSGNNGTNPGADYLGTGDFTDFFIQTNGTLAVDVKAAGLVGFSQTSPIAVGHFGVKNGTVGDPGAQGQFFNLSNTGYTFAGGGGGNYLVYSMIQVNGQPVFSVDGIAPSGPTSPPSITDLDPNDSASNEQAGTGYDPNVDAPPSYEIWALYVAGSAQSQDPTTTAIGTWTDLTQNQDVQLTWGPSAFGEVSNYYIVRNGTDSLILDGSVTNYLDNNTGWNLGGGEPAFPLPNYVFNIGGTPAPDATNCRFLSLGNGTYVDVPSSSCSATDDGTWASGGTTTPTSLPYPSLAVDGLTLGPDNGAGGYYWTLLGDGSATFGNSSLSISSSGVINYTPATASRAAAFDGSKNLVSVATTTTELGYVSGVTSAIQTQLNAKQASGTYANTVSNSDGTLTISPTSGSVVASIALSHANTWTGAQTISHIIPGGSAPSIAAGVGAGTSPTVSVSGKDVSGLVSVTTGTLPTGTNAVIATITFAAAYGAAPNCVLYPNNAITATLSGVSMVFSTSTTTTFVMTSGTTALTAATAYKWMYHCL